MLDSLKPCSILSLHECFSRYKVQYYFLNSLLHTYTCHRVLGELQVGSHVVWSTVKRTVCLLCISLIFFSKLNNGFNIWESTHSRLWIPRRNQAKSYYETIWKLLLDPELFIGLHAKNRKGRRSRGGGKSFHAMVEGLWCTGYICLSVICHLSIIYLSELATIVTLKEPHLLFLITRPLLVEYQSKLLHPIRSLLGLRDAGYMKQIHGFPRLPSLPKSKHSYKITSKSE